MKLKNKFVAFVTILFFVLSLTPSLAQCCGCKKNNDQESSSVRHSKKHKKQVALRHHNNKQVALSTKAPTFTTQQLNEQPQAFTITQ